MMRATCRLGLAAICSITVVGYLGAVGSCQRVRVAPSSPVDANGPIAVWQRESKGCREGFALPPSVRSSLEQLDEPSLCEARDSRIIRLTRNDSMSGVLQVIRAQWRGTDGDISVKQARRGDARGHSRLARLDVADWSALVSRASTVSSVPYDALGLDGETWVLETMVDGAYRVFERRIPEPGADGFRSTCDLILQIADSSSHDH